MRQGLAGGSALWPRPKSRLTRRMEALPFPIRRRLSVRGVAEDREVAVECVRRAIGQCVDNAYESADHGDVRVVGIDETSTREGRRRVATVVDARRGKTIRSRLGRGREVVARFGEDLKAHGGDPDAMPRHAST